VSEWHSYEQGEARHPDRPWWRWVAYEDRKGDERDMLVRIDGREAAAMAVSVLEIAEEIDREHPLPVPPPKCGQVWVWPTGFAATVQAVDPTGLIDPEGARRGGVVWPCTTPVTLPAAPYACGWSATSAWPPAGAVLVAGPGAPWAPMGAP
jgi:hypothetical protein